MKKVDIYHLFYWDDLRPTNGIAPIEAGTAGVELYIALNEAMGDGKLVSWQLIEQGMDESLFYSIKAKEYHQEIILL